MRSNFISSNLGLITYDIFGSVLAETFCSRINRKIDSMKHIHVHVDIRTLNKHRGSYLRYGGGLDLTMYSNSSHDGMNLLTKRVNLRLFIVTADFIEMF